MAANKELTASRHRHDQAACTKHGGRLTHVDSLFSSTHQEDSHQLNAQEHCGAVERLTEAHLLSRKGTARLHAMMLTGWVQSGDAML